MGILIKTHLSKIYSMIFYVIKRLLGLVEIFLFLRLALKFFGANPKALVVDIIYQGSDIFISPFKFIFPNIYWNGKLIEITTLSAMAGYAILVYILFQLLRLFSKE